MGSRQTPQSRHGRATRPTHRIVLRFLRSPLEITGEGEDGPVDGVVVGTNRIAGEGEMLRAEATGETETIECGLVLREGLRVLGV